MGLKFFYEQIVWERLKSQLTLVGAYLAKRGKKFQLDGTKRTVLKGQKLYLCKIQVGSKKHIDEVFKMLVLREGHGYQESDIQLVGENKNGTFVFDKEFLESMHRNRQAVSKVKLSEFRDG